MERPIVTISQGQIQGTTLNSVLGPSYYSFKGIPFAAPPVGPLRFKVPQPPESWVGIRDASEYVGKPCIQHKNDLVRDIAGSEDCLYLNVFTKTLKPNRPVMVFIHGGSFVESTANRDVYRQDYLVTQDAVVVYINYRLGPLGFLNLAHEVMPGNLGLRDIIYSLQWVQKNIAAFGGDPNNVTIFGSSAGAVICHLLTIIPKTKGLIHKAIIQSGTSNMLTTLVKKFNIKNGFRVAARLGMHSQDPVEVFEYLLNVPAKKLVECEDYILSKEEATQYEIKPYEPIIDVDYTSDPVIPGTIDELMKNDAHVPIIIGHTSDESLLCFVGRFNEETYKYYDENIESVLKHKLKDLKDLPIVLKDAKEFYFKNQPINKENEWNLIRLTSDFFIHSNRHIIDKRSEHARAPTYVYNFSYQGDEPTIYQTDHGPQPLKGVGHADELSYQFYLAYMKIRKESADKIYPKEGTLDRVIMERIIRMWYNFAATGNPTPETDEKYITTVWKPASKEHKYYLDINKDLTLCDDKDNESYKFFERNKNLFVKF